LAVADSIPSGVGKYDGASGQKGPGSNPDEVLFHEMVHASRVLKGVTYFLNVNQGYNQEEDYLSVVITNIYLSEKGQAYLRGDHGPFGTKLDDPQGFLDNQQRVNLSPRVLLERFRRAQPMFFAGLAQIPSQLARWNPVRQYNIERTWWLITHGRLFQGWRT
jgi:hypothetical protein